MRAHRSVLVLVTVLASCGAATVRAQTSLEYNAKAALLLNFTRFIEWPDAAFAGPQSPVTLCVFARNPFGDALERSLQGEMVGNRPLALRVVRNTAGTDGCHLLFVPAGTESRAAASLRRTESHAVSVGESRRFETMGGAVTFVVDAGRVRFNVNLRPIEARGIRISARMLQLASRVVPATPAK